MPNKKIIFIIVVIVLAFGQIVSDLYLPSLPSIAASFHSNASAAQFSLSIYMVGFTLSQLIYGPVSDGIGRRRPLLIGLCLCLAGSIVCFLAQYIEAIIIGRFIQGLGAGATLTLSSAILRDIFEREELAKYSSYSALIGVGLLATAPLLGGYLEQYFGWRSNFLFLTVYALVAFFVFLLVVPETNTHKHPENLRISVIKINIRTLLTSPIFIGYCLCSLLVYGAILAWLTAGPIVLQTGVGLSPVAFGWSYFLTGVAFAIGALVNSKFVFRYGIQTMLRVGLLCVLASGLVMAGLKLMGYINGFVIIAPVIMLLFGASLVFPNTSAGVFQPFPRIAGIASALFYSARMLGGAVFSGILAFLPTHNQLPMALAFITSALLALLVFYFTLRPQEQPQI
ncbi:multidrug effflux MFS transporter [Aquicella lusitana]|uniref:Bcr/CflA family efflux transporter n=1 Tax=Aquicella lusitana TaxID=254246 RepID=A0A370GEI3_9COXI|nr:multidrug effflux MFS transporter [Aquicella lusitana]RDI42091.1 DHA1 family bicyclomycin/chloramphenicol resistance-like MFS transporter/DHA1 family 2-module integral membrane pump EmrD-like MFS transporter [Aquicella lusitana]VVC74402.1 Bicyclomycin resistance protein [Aquicella lusitana]